MLEIYVQKNKTLKVLEFPKVALKILEFVMSIYLLHNINICMRNYGINDVSKRVNVASRK